MEFIRQLLQNEVWNKVIVSAILLIVTLIAAKLLSGILKRMANSERFNSTFLLLLRKIVTVVVIALGICFILLQFEPFKKFILSLLAGSSLLVLILGFAAQEATANLVSGVFISLFKPFGIGDRIKLSDKQIDGVVEDISLRHTIIRTFENTRIVVPNSVLNSAVIENVNFGEDKVCTYLDIGISYDADIEKAIEIVIDEAVTHKDFYDNRTEEQRQENAPPITVRVVNLGDYAIQIRAFIWAKSALAGAAMCSDLRIQIKQRFEREGIEIPYPYHNIIMKDNK